MSEQRPPRLNLPRDWRLEKPPTGDFRFLGHSDPRGHHDARGVLKKHSQFSPWVLHCVCGRVHSLPALPELPPGTAVMIDMIPPSSSLAELNLLEGTIVGLPRRPQEGEAAGGGDPTVYYPVCIKATGEVVDLPPAWIKTRLFAVRGIMYDGRKRFASRKGEDGSLPPLTPQYPHPILPPKRVNSGRQAMGLFLRNFRGFVCKGGCVHLIFCFCISRRTDQRTKQDRACAYSHPFRSLMIIYRSPRHQHRRAARGSVRIPRQRRRFTPVPNT